MNVATSEELCRSLLEAPPLPPRRLSIERSLALKRKALNLIPSCSQTFSKAPSQFVQGVAPVFLERGAGSHVWDVDGNEYLDSSMGLGAVILGYGDPKVVQAIAAQVQAGTIFTLPHPLELEVAQQLVEMVPSAQMVRFGKNGSDVTSAAVRVARAFTGRDRILCCGYHGWQDWFIATTTRDRGIPKAVGELTAVFRYNDLDSLQELFKAHPNQIAAVVMEPIGLIEPDPGFLEAVRELTHREGALLVFDEMVTGFRIGRGGAQERFGVSPDLTCFGKGLANGMPLSAIVGSQQVMKLFDEIFFSFTFGGETASLAAAQVTIETLRQPGTLEKLWERGEQLKTGYNQLAKHFKIDKITQCVGLPPRTVVEFDSGQADSLVMKSFVQQECIKRGFLFTATHNMSLAHSEEDIRTALQVYRTVLELFANTLKAGKLTDALEGSVLEPVFRKP